VRDCSPRSSPSGNERFYLDICRIAEEKGSMELTAEQAELFPIFASKVNSVPSRVRQWLMATEKHGPLMTQSLAASALGVTRSRIHQLVNEDRIAVVEVAGERFIPATAVELFMSEKRGVGIQPKNQRKRLLRTMWEEANRVADSLT